MAVKCKKHAFFSLVFCTWRPFKDRWAHPFPPPFFLMIMLKKDEVWGTTGLKNHLNSSYSSYCTISCLKLRNVAKNCNFLPRPIVKISPDYRWNQLFFICGWELYAKTMSNYPTDKPFEPTERYMCIWKGVRKGVRLFLYESHRLNEKSGENFGIRSPVDDIYIELSSPINVREGRTPFRTRFLIMWLVM